MTKADLVQEISKQTGIDRDEVLMIVESFMETVKGSLSRGKEVYLRGFGSFIIKRRAEKTGRNIGQGRKQHKGLNTWKRSCPHSCHFSFCFPAVQSPPIRFLGDFQHFQGFPCLFLPFWLLRPLCASYRLLHASILETQVLPQAADLLWAWCPFSFGGCTVPAYRCNPPSLGLRVFP